MRIRDRVYYDVNIINYSNHDFTTSLNIEVSKGKLPATDIAFFNNMEEVSYINGTEVFIALSDSGHYYINFIYKNVGFRIISEGIPQNSLTELLESLIK